MAKRDAWRKTIVKQKRLPFKYFNSVDYWVCYRIQYWTPVEVQVEIMAKMMNEAKSANRSKNKQISKSDQGQSWD